MRKFLIFLIFLLTLILGIFVLNKKNLNEQQTPKAAATIFPIFDILRNVAGDSIETVLILSPGASPHTFDASPSDIKNLSNSSAVFTIGHGLDNWILPLAKNAEVERIIIVDKSISLRQFDDEGIDPHYWLSVPNAILIAQQIKDELSLIYPEKAPFFRTNTDSFIQKLNRLDQETKTQFVSLENREIATFHAAWNYFADEYGLNVTATFEEFPGKEPTPSYLADFQEKIKKHHIKVIFSEPQFSTTPLQAIAADLDVTISALDPVGGVEGRESYELLIKYNVGQISNF